jgi:hypothetical protein
LSPGCGFVGGESISDGGFFFGRGTVFAPGAAAGIASGLRIAFASTVGGCGGDGCGTNDGVLSHAFGVGVAGANGGVILEEIIAVVESAAAASRWQPSESVLYVGGSVADSGRAGDCEPGDREGDTTIASQVEQKIAAAVTRKLSVCATVCKAENKSTEQ